MGRNKYSQKEINEIKRLLALKNKANRFGQKQIRHELRTTYEFNISDFNEPGKAFGPEELDDAVRRKAIHILDEATIANMLAKRARDRERDKQLAEAEAETAPKDDAADWQKALKEWEDWENAQQTKEEQN